MKAERRRRAIERRFQWKDDPVAFARDALGVEPWNRQRDILNAVATHDRVAVRSGHKVSKSNSAAILALWFASTRPKALVVLTSATARQVKRILWKELGDRVRVAPYPFDCSIAKDPETGVTLPGESFIYGLSTNEPEKMAGVSGSQLLFILDEASGISEGIFEAIEGNRAGGAKIVMFSNPTITSGTFFDAFHDKRQFWKTIHISSEESPNVIAGREVIPGLAGRPWVEEKKLEWGEESPLYRVRVKGDFPSQASNSVIGLALVDAARKRWEDAPDVGDLVLGVDVARFGDDDTVIQPVRGNKALPCIVMHSMDTVQVAARCVAVAHQLRRPNETVRINVDEIGVGGGVVDILKAEDRAHETETYGINVADKATSENEALLRDQLWIALRDWLKEMGAIPADSKLEGELVAPRYGFTPAGKIKVEPKAEMKKRLGRSPDRADALALAVYRPEAGTAQNWAKASLGGLWG